MSSSTFIKHLTLPQSHTYLCNTNYHFLFVSFELSRFRICRFSLFVPTSINFSLVAVALELANTFKTCKTKVTASITETATNAGLTQVSSPSLDQSVQYSENASKIPTLVVFSERLVFVFLLNNYSTSWNPNKNPNKYVFKNEKNFRNVLMCLRTGYGSLQCYL